jgi:hypothetical protein
LSFAIYEANRKIITVDKRRRRNPRPKITFKRKAAEPCNSAAFLLPAASLGSYRLPVLFAVMIVVAFAMMIAMPFAMMIAVPFTVMFTVPFAMMIAMPFTMMIAMPFAVGPMTMFGFPAAAAVIAASATIVEAMPAPAVAVAPAGPGTNA